MGVCGMLKENRRVVLGGERAGRWYLAGGAPSCFYWWFPLFGIGRQPKLKAPRDGRSGLECVMHTEEN